jgi:hypothetical protein
MLCSIASKSFSKSNCEERKDYSRGIFAPRRRLVFAERIVRKAIEPVFCRLRGSNDRVSGGARVFAGVPIRRAVAAQGDTALLTGPEMDPLRADFHALGAFANLRQFDGPDRVEMSAASIGHN